jgi:hypothetical protein
MAIEDLIATKINTSHFRHGTFESVRQLHLSDQSRDATRTRPLEDADFGGEGLNLS